MNCREAYLYICDNLDARVNSAKCREVRKHLKACPDCTALLDSVKKTVALYRSMPSPRVPSAVHKRLIKTVNLAWQSKAEPRRRA